MNTYKNIDFNDIDIEEIPKCKKNIRFGKYRFKVIKKYVKDKYYPYSKYKTTLYYPQKKTLLIGWTYFNFDHTVFYGLGVIFFIASLFLINSGIYPIIGFGLSVLSFILNLKVPALGYPTKDEAKRLIDENEIYLANKKENKKRKIEYEYI